MAVGRWKAKDWERTREDLVDGEVHVAIGILENSGDVFRGPIGTDAFDLSYLRLQLVVGCLLLALGRLSARRRSSLCVAALLLLLLGRLLAPAYILLGLLLRLLLRLCGGGGGLLLVPGRHRVVCFVLKIAPSGRDAGGWG